MPASHPTSHPSNIPQACKGSEGPSGYRRGSGYCSWEYWRAWLPGLVSSSPGTPGWLEPPREGGKDMSLAHSGGLPEVCSLAQQTSAWLPGSSPAPAQVAPSGPGFRSYVSRP